MKKLAFIISLFICTQSYGSSIGPNSTGTTADDATVGTVSWINTDNIKVTDDTYATAPVPGTTSHYIKATNFGFSIPSGSIIRGVLVEFERHVTGAMGTGVTDNSVKLVVGGSITGNEKSAGASWAATDQYDSFGGANDTWGVSLTADNINGSDFGVVLSCTGNGADRVGLVDHARITVFYDTNKTVIF